MNLPEAWKPLLLARADELCIPADSFQRSVDASPPEAQPTPDQPSHIWVCIKNQNTLCYIPRHTPWAMVLFCFKLTDTPPWLDPQLPLT